MNHTTDHDDLAAALRRCGSHWTSAQAHGLLCGCLAVGGESGAQAWGQQVMEGLDSNNALCVECSGLLDALMQSTWLQLAERQSNFELLLPNDAAADVRAQAIAEWCEGFLHGLVANKHTGIRERLAAEPLSDMIRDMLEITRAEVGEDDGEEDTEVAYVELVEYIRVAAQLAFEELADLRDRPAPAKSSEEPGGTLH